MAADSQPSNEPDLHLADRDDAARPLHVAVVGCGYVGLVTGVALASIGHHVTGVEISDARREQIASGIPPFFEPGLEKLLTTTLDEGRFAVTGAMAAVADADVVLLAVQTPPTADGAIDLQYLRNAAASVAEAFATAPRRRVVAVRSTVVPGTVESVVAPVFDDERSPTAVASNPEFLSEGSAVNDFLDADRVVVGCDSPWGRELLHQLYEPLQTEIVMVSPSTAELSKYTSNALLATLISFSNEIARISESLPGVDVEDVLGIVHRDRRLSPRIDGQVVSPKILSYLKSGCGYGGSCLPKDLSALLAHRSAQGHAHPLLSAVREINDHQPGRVVDMAHRALGGLEGRAVTVLGVAFKSGTDDVRSSPGLQMVDELVARGARVTVFDPLVGADAPALVDRRDRIAVADSLDDALDGADACIIATLAPVFATVSELTRDAGTPIVIDGRRLLPDEAIADHVLAVGRGTRPVSR